MKADGVRFLDNCICDHWKDVDAMMELSTSELPPEVTDEVSIIYHVLSMLFYNGISIAIEVITV